MLPRHIAVIMDGNGRWAKLRGKPRTFGHKKGADILEGLCDHAFEKGIKYVSFYAFSTENWSRPAEEIDKLMSIMKTAIKKFVPKFIKKNIRLTVSGDIYFEKIPEADRALILDAVEKTKDMTAGIVNICFNYGSRSELVRAANEAAKGGLPITEEGIAANLWTKDLPDVDLLIRTSGEIRLSNFMLWQAAYAELYFTDCLWPDFNNEELDKALEWFENRKRRFGGV
ncbi:MAG: di-trans,poly-cis-decaprenylcistransferase [Clostridia bacterium]|nr:di-trans,poly-cis-decaprenylcistransferase [Clostridia bacterium]